MDDFITTAQGQAKLANSEDLIKDAQGVTDPNLHRRITAGYIEYNDYILSTPDSYEIATPDGYSLVATVADYFPGDTQYALVVQAVNSYRTTEHIVHNEDSTTSEIP